MKRVPDCEQIYCDRSLSLKEKKSKLTFENPNFLEICNLKVDNCAIKEGLRCDYAMTVETIAEEFYIELKGRDVKHAFNQLKATIQTISANAKNQPKLCFIISTRVPLTSPEIQLAAKEFQSKFNAKLVVKTLQHSHTLK
jgi:hypothetical protein